MSTLLEIVELPDGKIVLRKADEDSTSLVSIAFSEEALFFLGENKFVVAKAMIEAGLDVASDAEEAVDLDFDGENTPDTKSLLH